MGSRAPRDPTLGYGQFYGRPEIRRELAGFSLATITATQPPADVPDHTHDTAHIVLVIAGDYLTSAAPAESRPPALVYNPPATKHADRFRGNQGVFFTLSITDRSLESVGVRRLPSRPMSLASGPAVRLARRLARRCESWPRRSRAETEAWCLALLAQFLDDAAAARPRPPDWLVSTRARLSADVADAPSLRDLAKEAAVHPVHVIRSFRRFYGLTPKAFVRERRLDAAAALLRTTDLPIVEIALSTGFADQSHFTRAFRRGYGTPPAAFRRETRRTEA